MKKKKGKQRKKVNKKLTVIIVVLIIFATYLSYKTFCLFYYQTNYNEEIYNGIKQKGTITINHVDYDESEYLTFNNIKILNKFNDFEKSDQSTSDYVWYVKDVEDKKTYFSMGSIIFNSLVDSLKHESKDISYFSSEYSFNSYKKKTIENFLKKKGIKNDLDLLKYVERNGKNNNNIFTSISDMKAKYVIYTLIDVGIPEMENYTAINGDLSGYIFNMKKHKEVCIFKEEKNYYFSFGNIDYFTDEVILEILNSIIID